jgi:hypothetical protein
MITGPLIDPSPFGRPPAAARVRRLSISQGLNCSRLTWFQGRQAGKRIEMSHFGGETL